jgi:hypothetical protein
MVQKLYDWEKWFGKPRFALKRGRDYGCATSSMAQQVRNAASEHGVSVSITERAGGLDVIVRGEAPVCR